MNCKPEMSSSRVWPILLLYSSTRFKNGSDVANCIKNEKLIKSEVPNLPDYHTDHTAHNKRVWDCCMGVILEEISVSRSMCWCYNVTLIPRIKLKVWAYPSITKKMDSMELNKKLIYTNGNDLDTRHIKVMAPGESTSSMMSRHQRI